MKALLLVAVTLLLRNESVVEIRCLQPAWTFWFGVQQQVVFQPSVHQQDELTIVKAALLTMEMPTNASRKGKEMSVLFKCWAGFPRQWIWGRCHHIPLFFLISAISHLVLWACPDAVAPQICTWLMCTPSACPWGLPSACTVEDEPWV